eukprot:4855606-Amphidinium_carterae.1
MQNDAWASVADGSVELDPGALSIGAAGGGWEDVAAMEMEGLADASVSGWDAVAAEEAVAEPTSGGEEEQQAEVVVPDGRVP